MKYLVYVLFFVFSFIKSYAKLVIHIEESDSVYTIDTQAPSSVIDIDNFDALEVPFVDAIPSDYNGKMAVPITFLDKYCPEQFEIMGIDRYVADNPHYGKRFTINGKETYARILIQKR